MPSIELDNITKRFPDGTEAVRDVSLTIEDGEFFILVGPSGCGKSTLLNMIVGLDRPSEGEIRVDGERVNEVDARDRNMAMVFQSYAIYPHMSVRENLAFPLSVARMDPEETDKRVRRAAELLELEALLDRRPASLSGGQRQLVAMGRAIVREPSAFLLDEPLSNLDARLRVQMRTEIARLQKRLGTTTVYVTHDQTEAMTLGDRVAVLRAGELQQVGTPRQLYQSPANLFVAGFIGSPKMNLIPVSESSQSETGRTVTLGDLPPVTLPGQHQGGPATVLGVRPEHLHVNVDGPLKGRITAVERLGSETLVYAEVEGSSVVSKSVEDLNVAVDETVGFNFAERDYYLFDAKGEALPSTTQTAMR
jgi:multiple sugar transport system ATP-binding protein